MSLLSFVIVLLSEYLTLILHQRNFLYNNKEACAGEGGEGANPCGVNVGALDH